MLSFVANHGVVLEWRGVYTHSINVVYAIPLPSSHLSFFPPLILSPYHAQVILNMPVQYMFDASNIGYASKPGVTVGAWPVSTRVLTKYGVGTVVGYNTQSMMHEVRSCDCGGVTLLIKHMLQSDAMLTLY